MSAVLPTAVIVSPLTATACAIEKLGSTVSILPLLKMRLGAFCAVSQQAHNIRQQSSTAARTEAQRVTSPVAARRLVVRSIRSLLECREDMNRFVCVPGDRIGRTDAILPSDYKPAGA